MSSNDTQTLFMAFSGAKVVYLLNTECEKRTGVIKCEEYKSDCAAFLNRIIKKLEIKIK